MLLPRAACAAETQSFDEATAFILSQVRAIAAFAYRRSRGLPFIYPKPEYKYSANFLHMMFSMPYADYELRPEVVRALDLIFLLHADHEQNCSRPPYEWSPPARQVFSPA
jgi:citrate synthase